LIFPWLLFALIFEAKPVDCGGSGNIARFGLCGKKKRATKTHKSIKDEANTSLLLLFVPLVALFSETVKRAAGADVEVAVGNRRCCEALVVELVHCEHFPFARSLQYRHLPALAN
jgi:hypothetical protein